MCCKYNFAFTLSLLALVAVSSISCSSHFFLFKKIPDYLALARNPHFLIFFAERKIFFSYSARSPLGLSRPTKRRTTTIKSSNQAGVEYLVKLFFNISLGCRHDRKIFFWIGNIWWIGHPRLVQIRRFGLLLTIPLAVLSNLCRFSISSNLLFGLL